MVASWPRWSYLTFPNWQESCLMLWVKCSEQWLYLAVFVAVFFTSPPLLRLKSSLVVINPNLFVSSLLLSAPPTYRFPQIAPNAVLGLSHSVNTQCLCSSPATHLLLLVLFSPLSLSFLSGTVLILSLSSHFLFTLLHRNHRIGIWLFDWLT